MTSIVTARRTTLSLLAAVALLLTAGCVGPDPMGTLPPLPDRPGDTYDVPQPEPAPPETRPAPDTGGDALSLADCITIAIHNNDRSWIALLRARSAGARVGQALFAYWPQVEFSADSQRGLTHVLTEVEAQYLRTIHSTHVKATQTLLDGGVREARLESARAGRRAASHRYSGTLQEIALNTALSYYRLLAARSRLEVAQEAVSQRQNHLELARRNLKAGMGRQVEVLKAEAEKADAELSVVEARSRVRRQRGELASVMNLPVDATVEIQEPGERERLENEIKIERLLQQAADNRPELKSAVNQIQQSRQQIQGQQARRWPELNLTGSYGWRDTIMLPEERKEWSIALGLSFPLFSGFNTTYRITEARAQYHRAIAEYEDELQGVKLEVWKRYSDLLQAEESVKAAEDFLNSARESLQAAEEQYKLGQASIIELIDAQTTMTRARNRKVSAGLNLYIALSRLRRAVGKRWPNPEKAIEGTPADTPAKEAARPAGESVKPKETSGDESSGKKASGSS